MSSRSFRLETRSRARDEIKRIMQTVEKVRKWEKIWIETGLSNHLKVYKWVPVREEAKEEEEEPSKESQSVDAGEAATRDPADSQTMAEGALPEIQPAKEHSATLEAPVLSSDQPPPDLLMASDETTPTPSSAQEDTATTATATAEETEEAMESGSTAEGGVATAQGGPGCPVVDKAGDGVAEDREVGVGETGDANTGDGEAEDGQQETDLEQRRERQRERALSSGQGQEEESSRPRSPH